LRCRHDQRGFQSALGKWRIVETDLWEADDLNMLEPAFIEFQDDGRGEFRVGCVIGGLDCHYMSAATGHSTIVKT
jgi:hypothetical protein